MATGEGAGFEDQIASIIRDADERFDADLSSDIVGQSVEIEKVVPINPFKDDAAVDVTLRESITGGELALTVKKRVQCPECGYVCTGDDDVLHPAKCPECGVRFSALHEEAEEGDFQPSDKEQLLMYVNEQLMRSGRAPTFAQCVQDGPFVQHKTQRLLEELVNSGRLQKQTVIRDDEELTVYKPPE